jgi:prepilin-type N-terminal cleavage/methylation domain-containing protein
MPANLLHRSRSNGFTLVELMISIAIVLVLMLGINFVFGLTARTIGTGMALSSAGRDIRNARKVMQADFDNSVTVGESPALIIQSETIAAFQNRQDALADYD